MLDDGSVRKPTGPCEMKGTVTEDEIPTPARRPGSSSAEGVAYPPPETWPTGRLLSAAARRVERAWDAYLETWRLTHASVPVLVVLLPGPLSQREIAAKMHVTEQTIGRILRGLQDQGYITREPHAVDRRRRVVTVTPAGRQALAELDHAQTVESLIGNSLPPDDLDLLRRLLIEMVTALPQGEERPMV